MFVPLSQLPPSSKVWIYQADRKLTPDQETRIASALDSFTRKWEVHGSPLQASYEIRFNQFVVIAANDTASGCSIDASVRVMKEIGDGVSVNFFDRTSIAFKEESEIKLFTLKELKDALHSGLWNEHSMVFNNAISSLAEYETEWICKAGKTWLKRYFLSDSVAK